VNISFAKRLIRHDEEEQELQQRKAERDFVRGVLRRRHVFQNSVRDQCEGLAEEETDEESRGGDGGGDRTEQGLFADSSSEAESDVAEGVWQVYLGNEADTAQQEKYEEGEEDQEAEEGKEAQYPEAELEAGSDGEEGEGEDGVDGVDGVDSSIFACRPATPIDYEYEVMNEYFEDLPRVCVPVKHESMGRDYRARRGRTDWDTMQSEY